MAAPGPSADTDTGLDALVDDAGFFRSLVEHGSDAIVTIDDDSTIRYANQGVHRVLGYRPDDLIGDSLTTIMPPRFHDAHFDAVDHYLETGIADSTGTPSKCPASMPTATRSSCPSRSKNTSTTGSAPSPGSCATSPARKPTQPRSNRSKTSRTPSCRPAPRCHRRPRGRSRRRHHRLPGGVPVPV